MQTLPKGFHELEAGDNIEDFGEWGSVHKAGDELIILWHWGEWINAEAYRQGCINVNLPYRVQRSEA